MFSAKKLLKICFSILIVIWVSVCITIILSRLENVTPISLNIVTGSLIPFKQALCMNYTDNTLYSINGKFSYQVFGRNTSRSHPVLPSVHPPSVRYQNYFCCFSIKKSQQSVNQQSNHQQTNCQQSSCLQFNSSPNVNFSLNVLSLSSVSREQSVKKND